MRLQNINKYIYIYIYIEKLLKPTNNVNTTTKVTIFAKTETINSILHKRDQSTLLTYSSKAVLIRGSFFLFYSVNIMTVYMLSYLRIWSETEMRNR